MHALKERARFSALYDAVVVGRADVDGLAYAKLRERFRRHGLIFRRVLNRARGYNHALAGHQPGRRSDGSDGAGVGERNRSALKIRNRELARARSLNLVVVGFKKLREGHGVCALDVRDKQRTSAVLFLKVDGDA